MIALIAATAATCSAFPTLADNTVAVTTATISPAAIGADRRLVEPPRTMPTYAIGDLVYGGFGISIRSSDPRAALIEVDGTEGILHACGYRVEGPTAWDGPSAGKATSAFSFRQDAVQSDAEHAGPAKSKPTPVLAGYAASGSTVVWTRGGTIRVGIMHPAGKRSATTIMVAFADLPGRQPAHMLARLPMRFDGIAAVPYVHSDAVALNLDGRAADGSINRIILDLNSAQRETIASELLEHKR